MSIDGNERNVRKGFILLKERMQSLENNKFEKRAFMYFDILSWRESKIERRSVQETVKEKAKAKINLYKKSSQNL